jgi:hypothetical protein
MPTNVSSTYTSSTSVTVPDNASTVTFVVSSPRGGNGGNDGAAGGSGGRGRRGTFTSLSNSNFTSRDYDIYVGGRGGDGSGCVSGGGRGSGGGGLNSGGLGGATGPQGCSGGGAGGGGSSAVVWTNAPGGSKNIIVAGAGGGGGGGSYPDSYLNGGTGGNGGGWSSNNGGITNNGGGGTGSSQGGDGGGGGGGGAGAGGGGGGQQGADDRSGRYASGGGGGGGSVYDSTAVSLSSDNGTFFDDGYVTVSYIRYDTEVTEFSAVVNPVYGSSSVTLAFSAADYTTLTLTDNAGNSWDVTDDTTITINTGLQSVAGSNSPRSRTFTLTACAGSFCDASSPLTVNFYNDNSPDNFNIEDQTGLEPSIQHTFSAATINGIDYNVPVTCGTGLNFSTNQSTWNSTGTISNGQTLYLRAFSAGFNYTLNSDGTSQTNSKELVITIGTVTKTFYYITRAPETQEDFSLAATLQAYPYEDIDVVPDPNTTEYLETNSVLMDDIEFPSSNGLEVKADDPNVQVRIRRSGDSVFGQWQDIREI